MSRRKRSIDDDDDAEKATTVLNSAKKIKEAVPPPTSNDGSSSDEEIITLRPNRPKPAMLPPGSNPREYHSSFPISCPFSRQSLHCTNAKYESAVRYLQQSVTAGLPTRLIQEGTG